MPNAEILHSFLHSVWIKADVDVVDQIFAPGLRAEGFLPNMKLTPEDFKTMVMALLNLITLPEISFIKTVSDENWVCVLVRLRAESQINPAIINATGQVMARFEDGKIVEIYNHFDFMGLFEQLGLIPKDAIMLCLSGEPLV